MPHVVTQACCGDASCAYACPVNCIHPTPDEPDFATSEMVYIDPIACVDCGACISACPVNAIKPHTKLAPDELIFAEINKLFHADSDAGNGLESATRPAQAPVPRVVRIERSPLRVAIVGSGPAAMYAADELLKQRDVQVTVFDRLPHPYGLVRSGVAPDHPHTRAITRLFGMIDTQPGFEYQLNTQVGRDLDATDLAEHFHAVIYATGGSTDRRLDLPGEDLPGSYTATKFVAWYNGHPDHVNAEFDLSSDRAVIVGNGNVAVDVARILATDPERLASTDISPVALAALRQSSVREVVVLARRGPAQSAFTLPELVGLAVRDDIELIVDAPDGLDDGDESDVEVLQKLAVLREIAQRDPRPECRRIVLRFQTAPVSFEGTEQVTGLNVERTELSVDEAGTVRALPKAASAEVLEASLVLRAVGYRSVPIPGVPFDDRRGVIPNEDGRVLDAPDGAVVAGLYAAGWIKRGPTGFIGTNKSCSLGTVNNLLRDFNAGNLPEPKSRKALDKLLAPR